MKLNVKGLVFVGFAAAVFANAAAFAASDKIVTSKTYVDGKVVNSMEGDQTTVAPSVHAVKGAIQNAAANNKTITVETHDQTWSDSFTTNSATDETLTIPVMTGYSGQTSGKEGLVPAPTPADKGKFLAAEGNWQVITDNNTTYTFAEGSVDGSWKYSTDGGQTWASTEVPVHNVEVTTNKLPNGDSTTSVLTDSDTQYPTSKAVKVAIEAQATTNSNTYQPKFASEGANDNGIRFGGAGGTWKKIQHDASVTLTESQDRDSFTIGVNKTAQGSGIASAQEGSNNLATDYAVKDYVDSQTSAVLPTNPTGENTACSATNPCALVYDGTTVEWKRIEQ